MIQINEILNKNQSMYGAIADNPSRREESIKKFGRNFGKFDKEGSTYFWKIKSNEVDEYGMAKYVNYMYGYSKPQDQPERKDKTELMLACIRRLDNNGYLFDKSDHVEFYRQYSTKRGHNALMFTMYQDRYEAVSRMYDQTPNNKRIIDFLDNFYHKLNSKPEPVDYDFFPIVKEEPETIIVQSKINDMVPKPDARDPFDLNAGATLKGPKDLENYCKMLKQKGHAVGMVDHYFYTMQEKYPRLKT